MLHICIYLCMCRWIEFSVLLNYSKVRKSCVGLKVGFWALWIINFKIESFPFHRQFRSVMFSNIVSYIDCWVSFSNYWSPDTFVSNFDLFMKNSTTLFITTACLSEWSILSSWFIFKYIHRDYELVDHLRKLFFVYRLWCRVIR